MLIFGSVGIFRRFIPLPSAMLAFVRGILGALVLLVYMKATGHKFGHSLSRKVLLHLCITGMIMGANWMLLFEAYNYTTVAIATLCYYMQPAIVILLSPFIFREKLSPKKLLCVIVSVIAMTLVAGIWDESRTAVNLHGVLLGLGAALCYSLVVVLNKLNQVEDAYEKTVIQLLSASAVMIPYMLSSNSLTVERISMFSILMLLLVGVVHTGLAYALYFSSMQDLPAQSVAILSYLDPITALLLSAVLLCEQLSATALLGAVLIIGAALLNEFELSRHVKL